MKPDFQTFIIPKTDKHFINNLNKHKITVQAVKHNDLIIITMENKYYTKFTYLVHEKSIDVSNIQHYANF